MKNKGWITVLFALLGILKVSGTPTGVPATLTVPSNPLFKDTGVYLHTGDQVYIQATGKWAYIASGGNNPDGTFIWLVSDFYDPTGRAGFPYGADQFNVASVVCYQGTTPTPPNHVFLVGNGATYTAAIDGELWVGINDDYAGGDIRDNANAMAVSVTVSGQTPPTLCPPVFIEWFPQPTTPVGCSMVLRVLAVEVTGVNFYDNGNLLGAGQLQADGTYTFSWQPPSGNHAIYAVGLGCNGQAVQTPTKNISGTGSIAWSPAPTTPTVCSPIVLSVAVSHVSSVSFYDNGTLLGAGQLAQNGTYQFTWQPTAGVHSIYASGTVCEGQTIQTTTQTIDMTGVINWAPAPSVPLNCSGETLKVTVAHVASVQFFDNGTLLGNGQLAQDGSYQLNWAPAAGSHSLYARGLDCSGNPVQTATQVVNVFPSIVWYSQPEVPTTCAQMYLRVTAAFISGVTFYDNGTALTGMGQIAGGGYYILWQPSAGYHSLYAQGIGCNGQTVQTPPLNFTMTASIAWNQKPPTSVCMDVISTYYGYQDLSPITMTVTAPDVNSVVFYDNGTQLGYGIWQGGSGYYYNWRPSAGFHSFSAVATDCSGNTVSTTTAQIVPPTGLVAWWKGEANANDSINGNNGVAGSGLSYAAGEVGSGFLFNNADYGSGFIAVPASSSMDVGSGGGFTIEGWVNIGYINPNGGAPIIEWDSPTIDGLQLWVINGQRLYANLKDTSGGNHQIQEDSGAGSITLNTFKHVALTYDKTSGIARIYVNGVEVKNANFGSITPQTTFAANIGARTLNNWGSRFNQGIIDELSLYNRALSSTEIQNIFAQGSGGKSGVAAVTTQVGPPDGMAAWWPGEGSVVDLVNGNNGVAGTSLSYTTAEVGSGFLFNNLDYGSGFISIPASPSLDVGTGGGVTIEGWVSVASLNPYGGAPLVEWDSPTADGLQLWVIPGQKLYANLKDTSGNNHQIQEDFGSIGLNTFKHVALTYDKTSGIAHLYVDGRDVKSANFGNIIPQTSLQMNIGGRTLNGWGSRLNQGVIDELTLYNRALSGAEIFNRFISGSSGKCRFPTPYLSAAPLAGWKGENNTLDGVQLYGATWDGQLINPKTDGTQYLPGESGYAFNFANSSSYLLVDPSPDLTTYGNGYLTIEGWIKLTSINAAAPIAEYEQNLNTSNLGDLGLQFWTSAGGGLSATLIDTQGNSHSVSTPTGLLKPNAWTHVALTYDPGTQTATLYVNGNQAGQQTYPQSFIPQTTYKLVIGARTGFGGVYFPGMIDELWLYETALPADDIKLIYDSKSTGRSF